LLFTSDAGMLTESKLLDAGKDISADLIIAGHHGSDASLGDAFLDAVNPQAIVASHSAFPPAEQLNPETVKHWRSRGIQVIHQGESGGVTVRVDESGNLRLEGFADHSVVTLQPR
jgi:competence protein ComEC